jgi:hypothetical protein
MSNSRGSYATTGENTMRAFDKLPASARAALREASYDWATQPFLTGFERRGRWKTGKELAAYITKIDKAEVGAMAYRAYGTDHPQSVKPKRKPVKNGRR